MNYAFLWLLAMIFVALMGSFFVTDDNFLSTSNYRQQGYKYLNREI